MKKPVGELGSINAGAGSLQYQRAAIPETKEEIERWALDSALRAAKQVGAALYDLIGEPARNEKSHFDFSLPTATGTDYLDLMEVVLLKGQPYKNASTNYSIGEMAKQALDAITKKSKKYGRPKSPVHLLLYSTESRFFLDDHVLDLLSVWLNREPPVFATVKYIFPETTGAGLLKHVYPRPNAELAHVEEARLASAMILMGDFRNARVESDGSITIPIKNPLGEG